ncbi:MAG: phenylalanine--tRNA ligase subunit alpha, partial [Acidobacteriota bacterium]
MSDVQTQIESLKAAFIEELGQLSDVSVDDIRLPEAEAQLKQVDAAKTKYTGKKSRLAELKKTIGKTSPDERAATGQLIQQLENKIAAALERAESRLSGRISALKTEAGRLDVTIPGRRPPVGHLHPITIVRQKIEDIFVAMGYHIEDDREIETDYYNFDALNIPEGHPARESQDTFYTTTGLALRSQTSTVQIRAMERRGVPI